MQWLNSKGEGHPVNDIDRDKCRSVRDTLYKLPAKMFHKTELQDISLNDALQLVEDKILQPMAEKSVIKHMSWLSSSLNFAIEEGKIMRNFCKGLVNDGKKKQRKLRGNNRSLLTKNARLSYTGEDIIALIKALEFDKARPDRFWAFFLALYAGLRINEACQLYVEDIVLDGDIWVINMDENYPDKRCKSEAGMRSVPVHSALIHLGFLWFVALKKKEGHKRLFPHLIYHEKDGYKRPAGNYWSRINVKLNGGFKVSRKSFHSLRHNFVDCLKQARIFEPIAASIVGHAGDENMTFGVYGEDYSTRLKQEAVEHVHYDCINLVELRKRFFPSLDANYRPYYPGAENEL